MNIDDENKKIDFAFERASVQNFNQYLDLGIEFYENGLFEQAEVWFLKAIENEEIEANFYLGQLQMRRGQLEQAKLNFSIFFNAGVYLQNISFVEDFISPDFIYNSVAAQAGLGNEKSQFVLGNYFPRNSDDSIYWYELASKNGLKEAMYNLACIKHVLGEVSEARLWYRRAAGAGMIDALYNLAILYENSFASEFTEIQSGAQDDLSKMRNAANEFAEHTEYPLNVLEIDFSFDPLFGGNSNYIDTEELSVKYLAIAAELGHELSIAKLAETYFLAGYYQEAASSIALLDADIESDQVRLLSACIALASNDNSEIAKTLVSLLDNNEGDSSFWLGVHFEEKSNFDLAIYWYKRAWRAGNLQSAVNLRELFSEIDDLDAASDWYSKTLEYELMHLERVVGLQPHSMYDFLSRSDLGTPEEPVTSLVGLRTLLLISASLRANIFS